MMDSKKLTLKMKAQEAVQKASEAVKAATAALNEANNALESIRELEAEELDQVTGGFGSEWGGVPTVNENDYPVPGGNNP